MATQDIRLGPPNSDERCHVMAQRRVRVFMGGDSAQGDLLLSNRVETEEVTLVASSYDSHVRRGVSACEGFIAYTVKMKDPSRGAIRVIDTKSDGRVLLRDFDSTVTDLEFSRDGLNRLAAVDAKGNFFVWEFSLIGGNLTANVIYSDSSFADHNGFGVSWSPSPSTFAKIVGNNVEIVILHENQSFSSIPLPAAIHDYPVTDVSFSVPPLQDSDLPVPLPHLFAVAYRDGSVMVFTYTNAHSPLIRVKEFRPHDYPCESLFFTLAGPRLVSPLSPSVSCKHPLLLTSANKNTELKLWDALSWECVQTLTIVPPSSLDIPLALSMEAESSCLIISERKRNVLYALTLESPPATAPGEPRNYGRPRFTAITQFPILYPCLSFSITSAAFEAVDTQEVFSLSMVCQLTKKIERFRLHIVVPPVSWEDSGAAELVVPDEEELLRDQEPEEEPEDVFRAPAANGSAAASTDAAEVTHEQAKSFEALISSMTLSAPVPAFQPPPTPQQPERASTSPDSGKSEGSGAVAAPTTPSRPAVSSPASARLREPPLAEVWGHLLDVPRTNKHPDDVTSGGSLREGFLFVRPALADFLQGCFDTTSVHHNTSVSTKVKAYLDTVRKNLEDGRMTFVVNDLAEDAAYLKSIQMFGAIKEQSFTALCSTLGHLFLKEALPPPETHGTFDPNKSTSFPAALENILNHVVFLTAPVPSARVQAPKQSKKPIEKASSQKDSVGPAQKAPTVPSAGADKDKQIKSLSAKVESLQEELARLRAAAASSSSGAASSLSVSAPVTATISAPVASSGADSHEVLRHVEDLLHRHFEAHRLHEQQCREEHRHIEAEKKRS